MIIKLPHRDVTLDTRKDFVPDSEGRKKIVRELLAEKIEFHSELISLEEYLVHTWENPNSKAIMDLLGFYLARFSPLEEETLDTDYYGKTITEDRFVLSEKKEVAMKKGSKKYLTSDDLNRTLYGGNI